MNPTTGIRSVNEYRYNTSFEIIQQSLKAFSKENECVLSITMKNDLSERDDNGNWTKNKVQLTYWEKGQRSQINQVEQTRVISYWDQECQEFVLAHNLDTQFLGFLEFGGAHVLTSENEGGLA